MSDKQTKIPKTLHDHLSRAGQRGAANQPHAAKVAGGIAGAKERWKNRKLCPACRRTATPEQVEAGTAVAAN